MNKKKIIIGVFISLFFALGLAGSARFSVFAQVSGVDDAIAVRVLPNPDHYSPMQWYRENGYKGDPKPMKVDGYPAVRDGRTVYVNVANVESGNLYTNIYLISYTKESTPETKSIFDQILKHWKFNSNLGDRSGDCYGQEKEETCISDADCSGGGFCDSEKAELARDTQRLGDIVYMRELIDNYRQKNGEFPRLEAGTYLPGITVSTWPSWQRELGSALGGDIPNDPVNDMAECVNSPFVPQPAPVEEFDPETCWNDKEKLFIDTDPSDGIELPYGSKAFVYQVRDKGQSYDLCAYMESGYFAQLGGEYGSCTGSSRGNQTPRISCGTLMGFSGDPLNGYVEVSDPEGDALEIEVNGLNSQFSYDIDAENGKIRIYGDSPNKGEYEFTVRVQDEYGGRTSKQCEAIVKEEEFILYPIADQVAPVGRDIGFTVYANHSKKDYEGMQFEFSNAPSGLACENAPSVSDSGNLRTECYDVSEFSFVNSTEEMDDRVDQSQSDVNYLGSSSADNVNFYFRDGPSVPCDDHPDSTFTLKYTGTIYLPETGEYVFGAASDDNSDMIINGEVVAGCYQNGVTAPFPDSSCRTTKYMESGYYPFEFRFYERGGWEWASAFWKRPSGDLEIIPAEYFVPLGGSSSASEEDNIGDDGRYFCRIKYSSDSVMSYNNIMIQASNSSGDTSTEQSFDLSFYNDKPEIIEPINCDDNTREGEGYSDCRVEATDPNGHSINDWRLSGGPSNLSIRNEAGVGVISGTPTATGTYEVEIRAVDEFGLESEPVSFELSVNTYCGDGVKQRPNMEGLGGPDNDGYEHCDGESGTPSPPESGPSRQYGCTNNCIGKNDGYCGDGLIQDGESGTETLRLYGEEKTVEFSHYNEDYGEQCDDGNDIPNDGCDTQGGCYWTCGDGMLNDGRGREGDGGYWKNSVAGDPNNKQACEEVGGQLPCWVSEDCDDGNDVPSDGCDVSNNCQWRCGDGAVNQGEDCDDGNNVEGDGCNTITNNCQYECGDGAVNGNEDCEHEVNGNYYCNYGDLDNDGEDNCSDNCPEVSNPSQADADDDGIGDLCDQCFNYPPDSNECLEFTVSQGNWSVIISPYATEKTVSDFYCYDTDCPACIDNDPKTMCNNNPVSSNITEYSITKDERSALFVYLDTDNEKLSLVMIHDTPELDTDDPEGGATFNFSGYDGFIVGVRDDPGDSWGNNSIITWTWNDIRTDGAALEMGNLDTSWELTITPSFNEAISTWMLKEPGGIDEGEEIPHIDQPITIEYNP